MTVGNIFQFPGKTVDHLFVLIAGIVLENLKLLFGILIVKIGRVISKVGFQRFLAVDGSPELVR